jgi:Zn-dependent peptidase ImmA (M78 family)/transcriptional regulator with XRE-family HTH domain
MPFQRRVQMEQTKLDLVPSIEERGLPNFNQLMLTVAREAEGMTQAQLAEEMHIAQGTLSKIESGAIGISDAQLQTLSEVLRKPKAFFLQQEMVYGVSSGCLYHRKRSTMRHGDLKKIIAAVNIKRMQVDRLLRSSEIEADNKFHRLDIQDFGNPEQLAQMIRANWTMPAGQVTNLTAFIEAAGGVIIPLNFDTRKLDAMSQWLPGLPPLFFVNDQAPGDRLRFTLAHELGHIIMHAVPHEGNMETEADQFAAEFLMPASVIKPQLSNLTLPKLAQLKTVWKVSMQALLRRAVDLGTITDRQKSYLWMQLGKSGMRMVEPIPIAPERSSLLPAMLDAHLQELGYTEQELADLVMCNKEDFAREFLGQKMQIVR